VADDKSPAVEAFCKLTEKLNNLITDGGTHVNATEAIAAARQQVRTFAGGLFIDLIHFCELLAAIPCRDRSVQTEITAVVNELRRTIVENEFSCAQQHCNGTSIFFPNEIFAKQYAEQGFSRFYNDLDFSKETKWGAFLDNFIAESIPQSRKMRGVAAY
jgi:hypothetical protein